MFVSKGGQLKAEVRASSFVLEGRLEGNLTAEDRVEIRATGQMIGDLHAVKLLVVEGATFVGRCEVGADVRGKGETGKAAAPAARVGPPAAGAPRRPPVRDAGAEGWSGSAPRPGGASSARTATTLSTWHGREVRELPGLPPGSSPRR